MAGEVEVWSEECMWPFRPSGDGETCEETHVAADRLEMFGRTLLRCPVRRGGYVYAYDAGRFVRRGLPTWAALEELASLVEPWERTPPSSGMRESQTSRALDDLSMQVRWACWGRLPESWEMLRPDAMANLIRRLRHCKNVSATVLSTLQRFGELYDQGLLTRGEFNRLFA